VQIRIRRARRSDSTNPTRIAHAAKRHWGYPETLIRLWKAELTLTPELVVRQPVYCAVSASRVVGFYALSDRGATPELEHMWVRPTHMASGVGRSLFSHLLKQLHAMGAVRLRIASDPNAEGFYRRMGARRVGRVPSKPAGRYLPLLVVDPRRVPASGISMRVRRLRSRRAACCLERSTLAWRHPRESGARN